MDIVSFGDYFVSNENSASLTIIDALAGERTDIVLYTTGLGPLPTNLPMLFDQQSIYDNSLVTCYVEHVPRCLVDKFVLLSQIRHLLSERLFFLADIQIFTSDLEFLGNVSHFEYWVHVICREPALSGASSAAWLKTFGPNDAEFGGQVEPAWIEYEHVAEGMLPYIEATYAAKMNPLALYSLEMLDHSKIRMSPVDAASSLGCNADKLRNWRTGSWMVWPFSHTEEHWLGIESLSQMQARLLRMTEGRILVLDTKDREMLSEPPVFAG